MAQRRVRHLQSSDPMIALQLRCKPTRQDNYLHLEIALNYLSDAVFEARSSRQPTVSRGRVPTVRCRVCECAADVVLPARGGLNRSGQSDEQVGAAERLPVPTPQSQGNNRASPRCRSPE